MWHLRSLNDNNGIVIMDEKDVLKEVFWEFVKWVILSGSLKTKDLFITLGVCVYKSIS